MKSFYATRYASYDWLRNKLKELNLTFTERDVLDNFWGKEFKIDKPRGKGATAKIKALWDFGCHYCK